MSAFGIYAFLLFCENTVDILNMWFIKNHHLLNIRFKIQSYVSLSGKVHKACWKYQRVFFVVLHTHGVL